MYFLTLTCAAGEMDAVSGDLWEAGTAGVEEVNEPSAVHLVAAFECNDRREELLRQFERFSPLWTHVPDTDWVAETQRSWPGRSVGQKLFVAAQWSSEQTPPGRLRVIHNPGLACGTGEHPCTQLALLALERGVLPGMAVADIGTGSGILAVAALKLGASTVAAVDTDEAALGAARENLMLNELNALFVAGSADCLRKHSFHLTVANVNASVLLGLFEDLERMTRPGGILVLTGFPAEEMTPLLDLFPAAEISAIGEWRCLLTRLA